MKTVSLLTLLLIAAVHPASGADGLPRSTPEEQGVSSAALLEFVEAADSQIDQMNSLMLVRHGHVVAAGWWKPYSPESKHELYSLSKSFCSTAVGLAVAEGRLRVDDPVLKFFPEDAPATPGKNLKAMRVSDLLSMSTGHQTEPQFRASDKTWVQTFLAHDVAHKPGAHFQYNTPATYMQSAIVQKVTGQTVLDYLRPRLFEPLGIEDPEWGTSPQGITLGGYGLSVRTEDIAKFGQLYLQKGQWHGKQIVPAEWVAAATARQVSNGSDPASDWDQGYGYQFWRSRNGCYRGDGAFGQYCLVMPQQDAVLAITSGVRDMQSVLNLVWDKLLPAMQRAPLAADPAAASRLQKKLDSLIVPVPKGNASSELAGKLSEKTFVFGDNPGKLESLKLQSTAGDGPTTIVLRRGGQDQKIVCEHGRWHIGRISIGPYPNQNAGASGAWTAPETYLAKICLFETPFYLTLKFQFEGQMVKFDSEANVGFGPTKQPQITGQVQ